MLLSRIENQEVVTAFVPDDVFLRDQESTEKDHLSHLLRCIHGGTLCF